MEPFPHIFKNQFDILGFEPSLNVAKIAEKKLKVVSKFLILKTYPNLEL